ncbi:hypothetical protein LCGC14_0245660 [marine sediment metagenome]|uniref:Uncharacterized protein n=1 Tax=marine sediment metagenome TaxID=412755 RepID=A0A0F9U639_9ZZZZ
MTDTYTIYYTSYQDVPVQEWKRDITKDDIVKEMTACMEEHGWNNSENALFILEVKKMYDGKTYLEKLYERP